MILKAARTFERLPGTVFVVTYSRQVGVAQGIFKTQCAADKMRNRLEDLYGCQAHTRVGHFLPNGDIETI